MAFDIEKFKEEVKKLNNLLEDEQTGLSTWWIFLNKNMEEITKMYYGEVPKG